MDTYPAATVSDCLKLAWNLVRARLSFASPFDPVKVVCHWSRWLTQKHGSPDVVLRIPGLNTILVTGAPLSKHVLCPYPSSEGFNAGLLKKLSMSYLAPGALTILQNGAWEKLRPFNEQVLDMDAGTLPISVDVAVTGAFGQVVRSDSDIRDGMRRIMLHVVFGEGVAPARMAHDVETLFGLVESPLKLAAFGLRELGRRKRFFNDLAAAWSVDAQPPRETLLSRAHLFASDLLPAQILQQVPHWMFTFTGSGTDLLTRTIALITSRDSVLARVVDELAGPEQPDPSIAMPFTRACLLESARLYPPVAKTFHQAPCGAQFEDKQIPPRTQLAHYFPLVTRDERLDPWANTFHPDRWLDDPEKASDLYPNLFLSGSRSCPGKALILHVCTGALRELLVVRGVRARSNILSHDPLPFTFPTGKAAYTS